MHSLRALQVFAELKLVIVNTRYGMVPFILQKDFLGGSVLGTWVARCEGKKIPTETYQSFPTDSTQAYQSFLWRPFHGLTGLWPVALDSPDSPDSPDSGQLYVTSMDSPDSPDSPVSGQLHWTRRRHI